MLHLLDGCGNQWYRLRTSDPHHRVVSSFEEGVIRAVNHGGDSDSTGLIAGHWLGAQYGAAAIPARWFDRLELRQVIVQIAEDVERIPREYCGYDGEFDQQIELAYPGS